MPRMSGYEVTIKAFFPCDVHRRGSIHDADDAVDGLVAEMRDHAGFLAVEAKVKYRQRAEISRNPEAADDVFREDEPTPAAHLLVQPSNRDPDAPAELRRKPA